MVIPLYLAPNDFSIDSPFDYLILIGSGISLITGIIGLASRSDAEKRWTRYRELRDRLGHLGRHGPVLRAGHQALGAQRPSQG